MSTHGSIKRILTLAIVAAIFSIPVAGLGQNSFNIDLDCEFCPPEGGGGRPSSSFFAAAGPNQAGFWNMIPASGMIDTALRDLSGNLTSVIMSGPSGGGGGGFNFDGNTGDFALLENDGRQVEHDVWTFSGLATGLYEIFTYSAWPNDFITRTAITVPGAEIETLIVTGPMPGDNRLIEGLTHSIHRIRHISGDLVIQIDRGPEHRAFVNGFQIAAVVPEPATLLGISTGLLALLMRRRRKPS